MHVRDRIKQLRRVPASELQPHPRNWRLHPAAQRNALRGVLAEVGYTDALLARELDGGGLQLIDGHLRAETTPTALVPVLVLDVTAQEAEKILLTHDPLAAMATPADEELQSLLDDVSIENSAVRQMLDDLAARRAGAVSDGLTDRPEVHIRECYQVVAECADEGEQQALYERLQSEGYRCRVLTL